MGLHGGQGQVEAVELPAFGVGEDEAERAEAADLHHRVTDDRSHERGPGGFRGQARPLRIGFDRHQLDIGAGGQPLDQPGRAHSEPSPDLENAAPGPHGGGQRHQHSPDAGLGGVLEAGPRRSLRRLQHAFGDARRRRDGHLPSFTFS